MEVNYQYHDVDLADIWQYERSLFLIGKSSEQFAKDLIEKIENVIIKKGNPFLATNKYNSGDRQYDQLFTIHIKDFQDSYSNFKKRFNLDYFFTNDYCFYFNQQIILQNNNEDFYFWFALKLRQYDSKLIEIKNFLKSQLQINFNNNTNELIDFLKVIIRQYKSEFLENIIVETVDEWIDQNRIKTQNSTKGQRKIVGKINTFCLKIFKTNFKFFEEPETIKNYQKTLIELKKGKFISTDTSYYNFVAIFKNKQVFKNQRIMWVGTKKELQWFVKYLVYDSKKVEVLKNDIWLVAIKCFINIEGEEFTIQQLRDANGNQIQRKQLLEKILFHL